jgi:tetratricopeptide (TPR) repeat protein
MPNLGEDAIFNVARRIAAPQARGPYLQEACGDDSALRQRIEALLAVYDQEQSFLQSPAAEAILPTLDAAAARTIISQEFHATAGVIGPYRLLEQIGEGGFGIVFLAEQQEPIRRKVALKIVKPGMDSKQIIARMEAERQALALMDHPNIATMLDAGQTPDGRPYFAMDLVKGVPITEYCDQQPLPTRRRLELFVDVCQAVHHAHQKGIIHRDIKPSNVLVTLQDQKPVVKVIDFGIAKALGQQLTDKTLLTGYTQMIGTPLYMSPEQAALSDVDIDTRSDIYSLGVLLYELLTGTTPFDRQRLKNADFDEVRRLIREEDPAKPSTRISTMEASAATTVSKRRQCDRKRLSSLLRGELDWIVMTALEKDRERRYGTASDLAADIQRYLQDEPVRACPPSSWYRWRKFARRRKAGLAIAGLILLFIVLLGGGGGWVVRDRTAREEELQRDQAARQSLLEERVTHALKQAGAAQAQGQWHDALATAARAEELLASEGGEQQRRQVHELRRDLELVTQVADVRLRSSADKDGYFDLALRDSAYAQLFREHGLDFSKGVDRAQVAGRIREKSTCLEVAAALHDWAMVCRKTRPATDTTWKDLLAIARAADPNPWRNQLRDAWEHFDADALEKLVQSDKVAELPAPTLALLGESLADTGRGEAAIQILRRAQLRYPADFWINLLLALALHRAEPARLDQAIGYYRAALAVRPQSPGVYVDLGAALREKDEVDAAIAMYQQAIHLNPNLMVAHHNLGFALQKQGKFEEAVAAHRQAVRLKKDDDWVHYGLGIALFRQGKTDEALAELELAVQLKGDNASTRSALGEVLRAKGRLDEAIAECREAIHLHEDYAAAHANLGAALGGKGLVDEAIAECRAAIRLDNDCEAGHYNLGRALIAKGQFDEALVEFQETLRINKNHAEAHSNLGNLLWRKGRLKEASAAQRKAIELKPDLYEAHLNLGVLLREQGDLDGAIAEDLAAIRINQGAAEAHSHLSFAYFGKRRFDDAVAAAQTAIHLDKALPEAHNNLALALHAKGRFDEAIAALQEAIRLNNQYPQAHFNLGIAWQHKGRLDDALTEFSEAIRLRPDYADAHGKLGSVLRAKGKLDEAIAAFRQGIRYREDLGWLHCDLGLALCVKGEFIQALAELRRGHELQPANSTEASESAKWIRDYEPLAALEKKLPDIVSGKQQPKDNEERLGVAFLCHQYKKQHAAAARLYAEALAAEPKINGNVPSIIRYKAACAAALAGCCQGTDGSSLDERERSRWRRQSLDWLRAELAVWRGLLTNADQKRRLAVDRCLGSWCQDASLEGIRDSKALAQLPAAERPDWEKLWQEIEDVRKAAVSPREPQGNRRP